MFYFPLKLFYLPYFPLFTRIILPSLILFLKFKTQLEIWQLNYTVEDRRNCYLKLCGHGHLSSWALMTSYSPALYFLYCENVQFGWALKSPLGIFPPKTP